MKISDLYVVSGGGYLGIFHSIRTKLYSLTNASYTFKYLDKMVGGNTNSLNLDVDYHLNQSINEINTYGARVAKILDTKKAYLDRVTGVEEKS